MSLSLLSCSSSCTTHPLIQFILILIHTHTHTHRKSCNSEKSDVRLASCTHCGATNWNILGDSDSGYVLSEGRCMCVCVCVCVCMCIRDYFFEGLSSMYVNAHVNDVPRKI